MLEKGDGVIVIGELNIDEANSATKSKSKVVSIINKYFSVITIGCQKLKKIRQRSIWRSCRKSKVSTTVQ
jgi:hypothetical protein